MMSVSLLRRSVAVLLRPLIVIAIAAGAASVASLPFALASDATGPRLAPPLLEAGAQAPDFSATAHDGRKVVLSKLKGRQVVLYFYPKDDTPGCTKEACEFRDSWGALQKAGVVVFGISTQSNKSHQAFAEKYKLPFPLLPDETGEIAAKYRVPVVDGKARRITYLLDPTGKIKHVWGNVNPVGHAAEILAEVAAR